MNKIKLMVNRMDAEAYTPDWQEQIAFARLHVLAGRGYRPLLGPRYSASGAIQLRHPLRGRPNGPANLILWSDGTLATPHLLWPEKYVPSELGSPDWQRFIAPHDDHAFQSFARSVARPSVWGACARAVGRVWRHPGARLALASAACFVLALIVKGVTIAFA